MKSKHEFIILFLSQLTSIDKVRWYFNLLTIVSDDLGSLSVRQNAGLIHSSPSLQPFYAAMDRGVGCRKPCEGRETLFSFLELTFSSS
jgi:hypothetical protein